jgi:spore maturation protein CgeB
MNQKLNIALFAHSMVSDWNHGNAHFLRGLMRELVRMGHTVRCYEELTSWSLTNLMKQEGERAIEAIDSFRRAYPELDIRFYKSGDAEFPHFLEEELRETDLVLLHEWNDPQVVNQVLALKKKLGFIALFHDSHHRAHTRAGEILKFHLHLVDGVLAFGEAIRRIYVDGFGVNRAWTFHEAADVALQKLVSANIEYRGYLPNLLSPQVYAESAVSVHIPRREYANGLAGIPTIRVFEALACGIPLVCSPWTDQENLFRPGEDYLIVNDGVEMTEQLRHLRRDGKARYQLAENGLKTIRERHTCAHRAQQLMEICQEISR